MDSLTQSIRARLAENHYLKSLPSFSVNAFFLLRIKFEDSLVLQYSTGRDALDELKFPVGVTQAKESLYRKPVQIVTFRTALDNVFGRDGINKFAETLCHDRFSSIVQSFDSGQSGGAFFQELMFMLDLFFQERRSSRHGCRVTDLDDIFWVLSSICVFGKPYGIAVFSGNNFDRKEVESGSGEGADLARLLTGLLIQECEDMVFSHISDRILSFVQSGRSLRKAVEPAIQEFFGDIPWAMAVGVSECISQFSHPRLGSNPVEYFIPDFLSETTEVRDILGMGTFRFHRRLTSLIDRIDDLTQATRERLRSSVVAGIASQSLSHNIGSHALSDARLFDSSKTVDGDGLKDFHQYLQGRMDYVAQLIARTPPQPEPLYLWGDLLGEFFRQRLLLNRLVADRSVEGDNLSFLIEFPLTIEKVGDNVVRCEDRNAAVKMMRGWLKDRTELLSTAKADMAGDLIWKRIDPTRKHCVYTTVTFGNKLQWWQLLGVSWKDIELALGLIAEKDDPTGVGKIKTGIPMAGPLEDLLVAIPGGGVGRHALYSILENLMRNSVKYGERRKFQNDLYIHLRVRNPDTQSGEQKRSEDYWLLEIWDEFSGFGKESEEQERYGKLAESFRQDVIDDEGKTRTSGHGLVEIKEAMRFLHDHKNSPESDETGTPSPWACRPHCHRTSPAHSKATCNEVCQQGKAECCHANLANTFDVDYDGIPNEVGTLVYRVRLRRPRLLGVWAEGLNFVEEECSSASKGVFFRKSLNESAGTSLPLTELCAHLLVIRDTDTEEIEGMVGKLAKEHWRLPFRLFVVTGDDGNHRAKLWKQTIETFENKAPSSPDTNYQEAFLPRHRIRVINAPKLYEKLGSPGEGLLDLAFVNEVYDHWLMAYKPLPGEGSPFSPENKWRLAVCFDRGREISKLWAAANDNAVKALRSISVSAYCTIRKPQEGGEYGAPEPIFAAGTNLSGISGAASRLIHFGNHGLRPPEDEFREALDDGTMRFSQEFGSKEAPRTFNLLYSPPADEHGFAFFALSIAEAALTDVAIFDERTAGVFLSDEVSKTLSGGRSREAFRANLRPLIAVNAFDAKDGAFAVDDLDWDAMGNTCPKIPTEQFFYPHPAISKREVDITSISGADVLVLHEGLIEELVSKGKFDPGSELCYLSRFPQIVRTSGKGRDPRKLDTRLPFCEYSALSAVLAPYKSGPHERIRLDKIMLAKAVLNTFGQLPKKDTGK